MTDDEQEKQRQSRTALIASVMVGPLTDYKARKKENKARAAAWRRYEMTYYPEPGVFDTAAMVADTEMRLDAYRDTFMPIGWRRKRTAKGKRRRGNATRGKDQ
jgi:hypothetical protein